MLREILYGQTEEPVLKRGLNAFAARHRALANNIANAETDNYTPKDVFFEEKLQWAMDRNKKGLNSELARHIPEHVELGHVIHEFIERPTGELAAGKTDVDIDTEMARLATNNAHYQLTARALSDYFHRMRIAYNKA